MKIQLVYPDWKGNAAGLQEPLGLLYIAAVLRKMGHEVNLIDMVKGDGLDKVKEYAKDSGLFIFSSVTVLMDRCTEVLKVIKGINPTAMCIIGGPHAELEAGDCLKRGFDYAMVGEGESTIKGFMEAMETDKFDDVKGIVYEKNGEVITNPKPGFSDINDIPFPARDLWNYGYYFKTGTTEIGMMATRGCPFKCTFCQPMLRDIFGSNMRIRTPENVVDEIEEIVQNYGNLFPGKVKFWFKDSTLTYVGTEWFRKFADIIEERNLKIEWGCHTRVHLVNEEMLKLMMKSGLTHISFGVESGSQKILDFYKKGITIDQVHKAFDLCHKLKLQNFGYFMVGSPNETREDLDLTWKLIKRIKPDGLDIFTVSPFSGNDLYKYVVENDLLLKTSDDTRMEDQLMIKNDNLTNEDVRLFKKKVYRYNTRRLAIKYLTSFQKIKKLLNYIKNRPDFVRHYIKRAI